jgi:hypothetical protein
LILTKNEGGFTKTRTLGVEFMETEAKYTGDFNALIEKIYPNLLSRMKTFMADTLALQQIWDLNANKFSKMNNKIQIAIWR